MSRSIPPVSLARNLVTDVLSPFSANDTNLETAMAFVRKRRDERGEPPDRKGHELVVERLLRPVVTDWITRQLDIDDNEAPLRINSSHFHTCDDDKWPDSWRVFQKCYRNADTHDAHGHLRRADLFICAGGQDIVSIEFKYVAPKRVPPWEACARQMRQYLRLHKASIMVIYAGSSPSPRLDVTIDRIRKKIGSRRAFVVALVGPPIDLP
jgi:hypothetical protein